MKRFFVTSVLLLMTVAILPASAQKRAKRNAEIEALMRTVEMLAAKVDSLQREVDNRVPVSKPIDPEWEKWQDVRYNYGFNTAHQPIFNTVDGVLESTVMLSVRGGRGRWNNQGRPTSAFVDGGHLFEGWNGTETCRLTMLIGKYAPDLACIQVYSPKGLYRDVRHFGWVKIGSDEKNQGVDFGRYWAKTFVPFSLAALNKTPEGIHYENCQLEGVGVPVGTLYYDTTVGKVRCYTHEGWRYLSFE